MQNENDDYLFVHEYLELVKKYNLVLVPAEGIKNLLVKTYDDFEGMDMYFPPINPYDNNRVANIWIVKKKEKVNG
jgi:hypothetical protein